jgi:hypothetical protein
MKILNQSFSTCAMLILLGVGLLSATGANAALVSALGGKVVNDTDLNITWLTNANLAASYSFGVSGILGNGGMQWSSAQSWIGAMNAADYLGFNNWRLPTSNTCGGNNCTGSEMGHLFYKELGGVAGSSILTKHNSNLALFQNVGLSRPYWSGTVAGSSNALSFNMFNGTQDNFYRGNSYFVWAVRSGQVSAVPEPSTCAMLLAGLGLLGFTARRKKGFNV